MRAALLSDREWEVVLEYTTTVRRPAHYRLLVLLMRKLGLRPMELAGLQRSWFRSGELRIPLGHSKRKAGRSLPTDHEIEQALVDHMGDRQGYVFINEAGEPFKPGLMSASCARIIREAGCEGSAYSGRRGASQRMLDNRENLVTIQRFLGHKSVLTTMEYVGVSETELRRAMFS